MEQSDAEEKDLARVEMSIIGDLVVPSRIDEIVGLSASVAWSKGAAHAGPRTGQTLHRYTGLWSIKVEDSDVEAAAIALLDRIEPLKQSLLIAAKEVSASIRIGIWWEPAARQGGFTMSGAIWRRLVENAERVDVYFPG
jgi:hypothetical protein